VTTATAARFAGVRLADLVRETGLFVLAIATIALHVLDDSFLQPSPGTSAGDHLVSGLVPLAVLALAAWIYPRLRGGRRGGVAGAGAGDEGRRGHAAQCRTLEELTSRHTCGHRGSPSHCRHFDRRM